MKSFKSFLNESSKLNWDMETDSDYNTIMYVNPIKLVKYVDPNFRVLPYDNKNQIGNRLERAIEHFKDGNPMTVAKVGYDIYNKKYPILFLDGRHRVAAAISLMQKEIPIAVPDYDVEKIKRLLSF